MDAFRGSGFSGKRKRAKTKSPRTTGGGDLQLGGLVGQGKGVRNPAPLLSVAQKRLTSRTVAATEGSHGVASGST